VGKPTKYSKDVAERVCELMAQGFTLREICKPDEMPAPSTVRWWVVNDVNGIAERYARAREAQADHWADEILEASDDGSNDWMVRQRRDGSDEVVVNREHVSRSQLRVDARKWLLAKLHPAKYGERVAVDATLNGRMTIDQMTPEERIKRAQAVIEKVRLILPKPANAA
jgi:hypothetical protein